MNREELKVTAQVELDHQARFRCRILCCMSTPCISSGAESVLAALTRSIEAGQMQTEVESVATGCMGPCSRGPLVTVKTEGKPDVIYENVTPDMVDSILARHVQGKTAPELDDKVLPNDIPFFAKQEKIVLSASGLVDPERLESYIARDGYSALGHALREMTPEEVCEAIAGSGLRGRGGAGYPTGLKWHMVRKAPGERKYVVANGDEGDPGAYMDRTLMESDPHRVLEGMAIAGYAVGAEQGYIYVRGEYPLAAKRLEKAIRQAERKGLLGNRIMDSPFNFRIDLRMGAGAFVCGEETALMQSIMGRRGQPVPRPPYPAQKGLWGGPTLINNVETFGNIAMIIAKGASWYAGFGTEKSKGSKTFALAGKVVNTGLIEVPIGITLREIVYEIGGGIPGGRAFKAAQTGGPSGGCIPAEFLDVPIDYESLAKLGSIMGSGGLIVMDETSCMPDVAKFFMEFCMDESCGKCNPCRGGTVQMHRILEHITDGSATMDDLTKLEDLCMMVKETSLCGLGQTSPNPIYSTLRYFRDEYEAHIRDHHCPAGVCQFGAKAQ
ncbi:MAG TPA: NADH-ubiquinone oxidoreductase-F iron-sulfur binding region domain-containing protein [Syntrophobacteraceae bacterium]|nr:NADH-ubiquinone oxidoreductase-F iron-sulfur binding region domain-containing protein [Syntrophobacteraceae bacterium]